MNAYLLELLTTCFVCVLINVMLHYIFGSSKHSYVFQNPPTLNQLFYLCCFFKLARERFLVSALWHVSQIRFAVPHQLQPHWVSLLEPRSRALPRQCCFVSWSFVFDGSQTCDGELRSFRFHLVCFCFSIRWHRSRLTQELTPSHLARFNMNPSQCLMGGTEPSTISSALTLWKHPQCWQWKKGQENSECVFPVECHLTEFFGLYCHSLYLFMCSLVGGDVWVWYT